MSVSWAAMAMSGEFLSVAVSHGSSDLTVVLLVAVILCDKGSSYYMISGS
jgi:hypothetical protein